MLNFFRNTEKELEKAKEKLISDLDNGSIDFLIQQMANEDIYSPLLIEKRKTQISGTDNISWYAYRRAEKLHLPTEKEQLLQKLSIETAPSLKRHIYFCLAHLCTNTVDRQLFNFLMDKLEIENDDCKLVILIGIEEMDKEADSNIQPIKKLTKTKSRDLKVHSILALKHTHDNEVEDLLLGLFNDTKDSHRKDMICSTLETVGTSKSIPVLQSEYKKTRDHGLRYSIQETIGKIKERETKE